jgi:hypothetical protein
MFRHLIIISFVFFLPGLCAAQTPDPGGIRVGDRWSYDIKDGLTGDPRNAITVVVAETNDKEITTRVTYQGKDRPQTNVYDPDWVELTTVAGSFAPAESESRSRSRLERNGNQMPTQ